MTDLIFKGEVSGQVAGHNLINAPVSGHVAGNNVVMIQLPQTLRVDEVELLQAYRSTTPAGRERLLKAAERLPQAKKPY